MIEYFISVTSHDLDPLPLSQTVTPSRTPSPLERDVLYGRPLIQLATSIIPASNVAYSRIKPTVFVSMPNRSVEKHTESKLSYIYISTYDLSFFYSIESESRVTAQDTKSGNFVHFRSLFPLTECSYKLFTGLLI